jgi:CheY-like chemotaxis protein
MNTYFEFIIIDDDPLNNLICNTLIKGSCSNCRVTSFTYPQRALLHIKENYQAEGENKIIVLLDINMPLLTGWEVLDELRKAGNNIINRLNIYILSSSVDGRDMEKAHRDPNVVDFISKPLRKDVLNKLLS